MERVKMKASITIIGVGRVGKLLHQALQRAGYDQISVISKGDEILFLNDFILITVPDHSIQLVVDSISDSGLKIKGKTLAHTSGVVGLDVFSNINQKNNNIGCFHPLMAVTEHSNSFEGITFDICGDVGFVKNIIPIIDDLGGKTMIVDEHEKAKLHVAAVITSNYLVTLMAMAQELFKNSELDKEQLKRALVPLMKSAIDNLESQNPKQALTGPISRGDVASIEKHLNILKDVPNLASSYSQLGQETIRLLGDNIDEEMKLKLTTLFDAP